MATWFSMLGLLGVVFGAHVARASMNGHRVGWEYVCWSIACSLLHFFGDIQGFRTGIKMGNYWIWLWKLDLWLVKLGQLSMFGEMAQFFGPKETEHVCLLFTLNLALRICSDRQSYSVVDSISSATNWSLYFRIPMRRLQIMWSWKIMNMINKSVYDGASFVQCNPSQQPSSLPGSLRSPVLTWTFDKWLFVA